MWKCVNKITSSWDFSRHSLRIEERCQHQHLLTPVPVRLATPNSCWKHACPATLALRSRALELPLPLRRRSELQPKERMGNLSKQPVNRATDIEENATMHLTFTPFDWLVFRQQFRPVPLPTSISIVTLCDLRAILSSLMSALHGRRGVPSRRSVCILMSR
jgi:hypothetical protein